MDIGATICTPKNPNCEKCPISSHCLAYINNEQEIFPHKKLSKLSKPERSTALLIFRNEKQEIFLKKRPIQGVWGGLWSFEECQDKESIISQKIKQHNTNATIQRRLEKFKHGFTHYDLWIKPVLIDSPGGCGNYYKKTGLSKGVPAPVKKIIHSLE